MRFSYHELFSGNNRKKGFVCFFATGNAAWDKPLLKRKFGNGAVYKISFTMKTSVSLRMHEALSEHYGLLNFTLLPQVVTGLAEDSFNPAYICLFKPQFIPSGFRQGFKAWCT